MNINWKRIRTIPIKFAITIDDINAQIIFFLQKHELKCGNKAEQELPVIENIVISYDDHEEEEVSSEPDKGGDVQTDFMAYFSLKNILTDELPRRNLSLL